MTKKRNRLEIIYDILRTIRERNKRIKPTHILYKSNLSYQMLEEYLSELIKNELIIERITEKGKTYSLTPKGQNYLEKYKLIIDFTKTFGLN